MYEAHQVLAALGRGRANGRSVHELRCELDGVAPGASQFGRRPGRERSLRLAVEALRAEGHPVCATPSDGYYLAETNEELESTIAFLNSRAMTSLVQIARMRRVSLPKLLGQMSLNLAAEGAK